jgi:hypothetical protein
MFLAGFQLPCFIPLTSTAPANEYMFASHTPHKQHGSHKTWHWVVFGNRQ